jgi:L-fucose mutarotase
MSQVISAPIIHPVILTALAAAGHRSTVLVADANYAVSTTIGVNAEVVYLNLEPGSPRIERVVELIAAMVPVESRLSMLIPSDDLGAAQEDVDKVIGRNVPHERVTREEFYAATRSESLALCIVTGDTRRFGNVLLTIVTNSGGSTFVDGWRVVLTTAELLVEQSASL